MELLVGPAQGARPLLLPLSRAETPFPVRKAFRDPGVATRTPGAEEVGAVGRSGVQSKSPTCAKCIPRRAPGGGSATGQPAPRPVAAPATRPPGAPARPDPDPDPEPEPHPPGAPAASRHAQLAPGWPEPRSPQPAAPGPPRALPTTSPPPPQPDGVQPVRALHLPVPPDAAQDVHRPRIPTERAPHAAPHLPRGPPRALRHAAGSAPRRAKDEPAAGPGPPQTPDLRVWPPQRPPPGQHAAGWRGQWQVSQWREFSSSSKPMGGVGRGGPGGGA